MNILLSARLLPDVEVTTGRRRDLSGFQPPVLEHVSLGRLCEPARVSRTEAQSTVLDLRNSSLAKEIPVFKKFN